MLCPVCSRFHTGSNMSLGVPCCRACARFFKLNISNRGKFICTSDENEDECLKKPSTKAARACSKCRLDKCLKVGMKLPPSPQTTQSNYIISFSPLSSPEPERRLQHNAAEHKHLKTAATIVKPKPPTESKNASTYSAPTPTTTLPELKSKPSISLHESITFSRTLDTLLDTAVNYPKLLELYLNYEILTLLNTSLEILHHVTVTERIDYISDLFLKYPIAFEELHIICMLCICKLELPWLPETQKYKIREAQKLGYKKIEEENIQENRLSELITLSEHCLNIFNAMITIK